MLSLTQSLSSLLFCAAANPGCSRLSAGFWSFYISGVIGPIVGQALSPANRALDQGQAWDWPPGRRLPGLYST